MFFGGAGAWIISKWGINLSLLDKPNSRSSHAMPTPKGGGVGILVVFILASLVLRIPANFWLPATFLCLFSFFGDKVELSPKLRLPIQFIASLILLVPILFFNSTTFLSHHALISNTPFILLLLSIIFLLLLSTFIVGTANFYNFMDGINGIAGITGIVSFGLLVLYASHSVPDAPLVVLAICISCACLGFLPFNMPKAKVFMGDVGSIFLGFVFAGMVVYLSKNLLDFICLAAFLFPFYADELTTMVVRLKDGESLLNPHRKHLYQLLANEMKIEHWKISVSYGLLQLLVGINILLLKSMGLLVILLLLALYFAGFSFLSFVVRRKLARIV